VKIYHKFTKTVFYVLLLIFGKLLVFWQDFNIFNR